ncbi:MAG: hypothetical protein DELT_00755 [Desulfovibrio sp.]
MKNFLSTLACLMNDTWYCECREPDPVEERPDTFMAMLACLMNDERFLHY